MTENEIFNRILTIFTDEFEIEPAQLTPEATLFDDLGLDSLDAVDLIVAIEKEFGVKILDEEAMRAVRTIKDVQNLITQQQLQNSREVNK